jgi:hypothetical protein
MGSADRAGGVAMPVNQEDLISDMDEMLLRQVHENFLVDDRLTSQAFQPNGGDEGLLSVDMNSLVDAKTAYKAYLGRGLNSAGVWGLRVGEFRHSHLSCFRDPLEGSPAHAVVDYSSLSGKPLKRVATKLASIARVRGKLYPTEAE